MEDKEEITVCKSCLRASCWQGLFMCDEAYHADVTHRTKEELKALELEHPSYWKIDRELAELKINRKANP